MRFRSDIFNLLSIILFCFCIIVSCSSSENDTSTSEKPMINSIQVNWTKTIGGNLEDEAKDIQITTDDGFIILGNTESIDGDVTDGSGTQDLWLIRLDASGNILWNKTYGGSNDDRAESISTTNDNGYIVTGYSRSTDGDLSKNSGSYDHWIIKFSETGDIEWEKSLGFQGDDRATSASQTKDGGYITTGYLDVETYEGPNEIKISPATALQQSPKNLHGVGEFWVHKIDAEGNVEWEQFYGGTSNEEAYEIIEVIDGFMLVGATESIDFDVTKNNGSYDYWIIKIDFQGNLIWQKSYGGSEIDTAYGIVEINSNNYVIVGDSRSTNGDKTDSFGNADIWVLQIDNQGNLLKQKSFGGEGFDTANDIIVANDGNLIISGSSRSSSVFLPENKGSSDIIVTKINSNTLEPIWTTSFGGSEFDFGYKVTQNKTNGSITVIGDTESDDKNVTLNKGQKDAFVINFKEK